MTFLAVIDNIIFHLGMFILPIFVVPFFSEISTFPKLLFLFLIAFFIMTIKLVKIISFKRFDININKYDLASLTILIVYLTSALFSSGNKIEAFFFPGTAGFIIISVVFYFFTNQIHKKYTNSLMYIFIITSFLISLGIILSFLGIIKLHPGVSFGNLATTCLYLLTTLPLVSYTLFNEENIFKKMLSFVSGLIILTAITVSVFQLMPNKTYSFENLSFDAGWRIAIDTIKEKPIFGVGPSNFINAFNKYRPLYFNNTPKWENKYLTNSNFILNVFTEAGLLGGVFFLIILFLIIKNIKIENPFSMSLIIAATGMLFLTPSNSFLPIFFIILSLSSREYTKIANNLNHRLPSYLISFPVFMVMLFLAYILVRVGLSEYYFTKSLREAKSKGNAATSYELINKAIKTNPYFDKYHIFSSTISFAVANSLSRKENIEEQDKEAITGLIQQAITEAKAGISLNKERSENWIILSDLYASIIPLAKGSDEFAIQSIKQAIFLDPINPILRVKLGGIYYLQGKYDQAIDTFKLAVLAKNDYANAHYNLSMAYKKAGDLQKAKDEIEIVLKLVGKESKSYDIAVKELEEIEGLNNPQENIGSF